MAKINRYPGNGLHRFQRLIRTGQYMTPWPARGTTTSAQSANYLIVTPMLLPRPMTFDRLAIQVTTGGAGGTLARLGVYADGTNLYPGALVKDVGTVAIDGVAVVAATISGNLSLAAGLYWLAYLANGAPTLRGHLLTMTPLGVRTTAFATDEMLWVVARDYGALPDPFPGSAAFATDIGMVFPRVLTLD